MNIKILIEAKQCGDIFPNNKVQAEKLFKELSKQFHPDINDDPQANEAFVNLSLLYQQAKDCFALGTWNEAKALYIKSVEGKSLKFKYSNYTEFELGKMYYSKNNVFYVIDKAHKKFYNNFVTRVQSLKYKNDKMKDEFSRYFPNIIGHFETTEGQYVIILKKTSDVVPLNQITDIPKEHQAWIISRLNNIACYLSYAGLVHNGISIDNCFVSPQYHTIMIYGGWWYCVENNGKMVGTKKEIFDVMPISSKTTKVANYQNDLESIKLIGRSIYDQTTPLPLNKWAERGSYEDAVKEFTNWNEVLEQGFGKRTFVKWNLDINNFY